MSERVTPQDHTVRGKRAPLLDARDGFVRSLRGPSRDSLLLAGACAAAAFALFVALAPHGFELGDAPLYASYIREQSLAYAPKHIGYQLLGIIFTSASPLAFDFSLNVLAALSAGLCVGLVGSIAYTIAGRRQALVTAAAALMVPYVFATQGTNAEVYAPHLMFFLLSVQLALWSKPIASGVAFAVAFLFTPATVLTVPFFALLRPDRRFLTRWAPAAILPSVLVLAPFYRDFLFGAHGVLTLAPANISLNEGVRKNSVEIAGFRAVLALSMIGLSLVARSRRHRLFLMALMLLYLVPLVVGERYSDVPLQLPFYAVIAVLAGLGASWALSIAPNRIAALGIAVVIGAATIGSAVPTYRLIAAEAEDVDRTKASFAAMGDAARPGDVAVAPYAVTILGDYYLGSSDITWIVDETLAGKNGRPEQDKASSALRQAIERRAAVWLPGEFDPSAFDFFAGVGYEVEPAATFMVARPAR